MTNPDDVATVLAYYSSALPEEAPRLPRFKAERATIDRLGGKAVEGTEEFVPRTELDELGRYRRVATGWGEPR